MTFAAADDSVCCRQPYRRYDFTKQAKFPAFSATFPLANKRHCTFLAAANIALTHHGSGKELKRKYHTHAGKLPKGSIPF
jgi:hypothetical protein